MAFIKKQSIGCVSMKKNLKEQAKKLPLSPGVYLMRDLHGSIIYVGKAKKLRERVSSYFIKNKSHSRKTLRLIQQLADFDIIEVDTELDALLLECQLIQTYRPIYNRQMNAFENYRYIEIASENNEVSLNILAAPKDQNCFGPFSTNRRLAELKRILEELYNLNPQNYWQQHFTSEPQKPFAQNIIATELLNAFNFKGQQPQKRLEEKMISASDNYSFEKALKFREDWLFVTRFFKQNQKLVLASQSDWQLLVLPFGKKIKYYLIHQGRVLNSYILTKQTFAKYTPDELANKILPKERPERITHFTKEQVDFINILYGYINQHKECRVFDLTDLFIQ